MKQTQDKPYKYYQRPTDKRVDAQHSSAKGWLAMLAILLIICAALVPIVHQLATNSKPAEQAVELRTSKHKSSRTKKSTATTAKRATKKKTKQLKVDKTENQQPKTKTVTTPKQYVVKSGETLTSIADKFNTTVGKLAELNNLSIDAQVDEGQNLTLR
ncbi:LysM domain-containing protein [Lactobacillus sp. ESL0681]|uniref:LysM peptidoglycan-binding domain-containing protein n=1 Tax=Lactobacillus sp. ESL0681 TaxID=2983211 RepID=UPI0023F9CDD0|nr:LysM domain-containing protein [Lactobacillus sp. ESL0681]WEV40645.1 LysM domain-containing protein [Lactobacillus sp. ESL0681]